MIINIQRILKNLIYENNATEFSKYLIDSYLSAVANYQKCFGKCQAKFGEEQVHNLRVSIRRLLVVLDVLINLTDSEHSKVARRFIKQQFNSMSELRDTQVMMLKVKGMVSDFPSIIEFYHYLLKKEKLGIRTVKDVLANNSLADSDGIFFFLKLDIDKKLSNADLNFSDVIEQTNLLFEDLSNNAQLVNSDDSQTIHQTRIAFKKFRYIYEFQIPAYSYVEFSSKELGNFQTKMGLVQDIEVIISSLMDYIEERSSLRDMMHIFTHLLEERHQLIDNFIQNQYFFKKYWEI